jgi:hypothetical protein
MWGALRPSWNGRIGFSIFAFASASLSKAL